MTVFSYLVIVAGAAALARGFMRFLSWLEK